MTDRFAKPKLTIASMLLVVASFSAAYYAVKGNPTDTHEKFIRMQETVNSLLAIGGKVIERNENFKYGSAHILLTMSDSGWSNNLMNAFDAALKERRWVMNENIDAYCLDGMHIKIRRHSGMLDGASTNYIGVTYNAQTIRDCSPTSPANPA